MRCGKKVAPAFITCARSSELCRYDGVLAKWASPHPSESDMENNMERVHRYTVPDVFDFPGRRGAETRPWLAAFAISAIIVGATLALVTANQASGADPQVTVSR